MSTPSYKKRAFTLIELILGMGLLVVLVSGIYGLARYNVQLSDSLIVSQKEKMHLTRFIELMRDTFATLPGNAKIHLSVEQSGQDYYSEIVIGDSPGTLAWGGFSSGVEDVVITTEEARGGALLVKVFYYEGDYLNDKQDNNLEEIEREIVLLEEVSFIDFYFYDKETEEWKPNWEQETRRPRMVEMILGLYSREEPIHHFFWVPPALDPAQLSGQRGQLNMGRP